MIAFVIGVVPPAGARGTAARMRRSRPVVTMVVQPPKLCPIMPMWSASISSAPAATSASITNDTSAGRWATNSFAWTSMLGGRRPACAAIVWRTTSSIVLPVWSGAATT